MIRAVWFMASQPAAVAAPSPEKPAPAATLVINTRLSAASHAKSGTVSPTLTTSQVTGIFGT